MSRRVDTTHTSPSILNPLGWNAAPSLGRGRGSVAGWLMPFDPVVGLLLSRNDLRAGHARSQDGNAILTGFISASLGKDGPKIGFAEVLRHAATRPIVGSQGCLRDHMTLFGSLREPTNRLRVILTDSFTCSIACAQGKLRRWISFFG